MFSAKALYSNVADTSEELSFCKGDVLEVLQKDENGWWVCSLKGKVGIAPGNRLRIISSTMNSRGTSPSGRNSPSINQALPCGQKLPPRSKSPYSQKFPATDSGVRPSWHVSNKVVVPKKSGNVYVYDSPNRILQEDYDVPPARGTGLLSPAAQSTRSPLDRSSTLDSDALQNYDVPSLLRSPIQLTLDPCDTYDKLPCDMRNISQPIKEATSSENASSLIYDIPPLYFTPGIEMEAISNRSSVLSVLSTGSHSSACSGHSSLSGSISVRSSADVSLQDIYDVPLSSRVTSAQEASRLLPKHPEQVGLVCNAADGLRGNTRLVTQSSLTSPYTRKELIRQSSAGPPCSLKLQVDRDSYLEDYSIPRSDISQSSGDSGISISNVDPFTSRSCTDEVYDTPRKLVDSETRQNSQKTEELAYDVPTRIATKSGQVNDSIERVTMDSSSVELYDSIEQVPNLTNGLVALQSSVLGHASKLISMINRILLEGARPEQELSQVKLLCLALKTALKEVIEFGNGVLFKALEDATNKDMSAKVVQLLDRVRVQLQFLSRHIEKLLTTQWPAKKPDVMPGEVSELDDNLNTIAMLTEAISGHLQSLTLFVVQNSSSMFRGSATEDSVSGFVNSERDRGLQDGRKHRPPLPPPLVKEKPKFGCDSFDKQLQVQDRPLPPVPCQVLTTPDCRNSRYHSPNNLQEMARVGSPGNGFKSCNLNEWNDECDYVSIANEAKKKKVPTATLR